MGDSKKRAHRWEGYRKRITKPLVPLSDPPDLIMEEIVTTVGRGDGPHGGRVEDGVPSVSGRGHGRIGCECGRTGTWRGDRQGAGRWEQLMITPLITPLNPRI